MRWPLSPNLSLYAPRSIMLCFSTNLKDAHAVPKRTECNKSFAAKCRLIFQTRAAKIPAAQQSLFLDARGRNAVAFQDKTTIPHNAPAIGKPNSIKNAK
jgi:hypothetical protein